MPKYLLVKKKGAKHWMGAWKAKKGISKEDMIKGREQLRRRSDVKAQTRIVGEKTMKKMLGTRKKRPRLGSFYNF